MPQPRTPAPSAGDYGDAFPNSRKLYVEGRHGIRVPMREISLSGGEPPLRVYDTTGPQGHDVNEGLPALRDRWIAARGDVATVDRARAPRPGTMPATLFRRTLRGTGAVTQLHYARRGVITPEMEFVALREGVEATLVRD